MEQTDTLAPVYHRVVERSDVGLRGFVVIDSLLGGHGTGGIRFSETVSLDEVANLAREMSLKFAWLDIPMGGAKAGIVAPSFCSGEKKQQLCEAFGREIADLIRDGRYVSGQDMGIGASDLATILGAAGARQEGGNPEIDAGYYTALTVFISAQVAMAVRGTSLRGSTVLLEGVGKVGQHLLRLLDSAGARLVGVSTAAGACYAAAGIDIMRLLQLQASHGDDCVHVLAGGEPLSAAELFVKQADLLIPGAQPDSIDADNVDRIRVRFITPAANICASEAMEARLAERDILYVPGFVTNCGGVFCWYLARLEADNREHLMRSGFARKVRRLIERADRRGRSVAAEARATAVVNARRMAMEESGGTAQHLIAAFRKLKPKRLGYIVAGKLMGSEWRRRSTRLCRWYYESRYFG